MKRSQIPIGTVFISYNNDDSLNHHIRGSKYNHVAILVDRNTLIEAQEQQGGVIITDLDTYLARDYTFGCLYPVSREIGIEAAEKAKSYLGFKYDAMSSKKRRPKLDKLKASGMNCISVVRQAYTEAVGKNLFLRLPDDFLKFTEIFTDDIAKSK